jgi:integrase
MSAKTSKQTVDSHSKNFLTENEIKRFLAGARKSRHSVRDFCLMLLAYRHGMRVSELVDVRLKDVDLETARIFVRRVKGSLSTHQPIEGDELRAIRAWLRERADYTNADSNYLFLSERGGPLTRQAINYIAEEAEGKVKFQSHAAYASPLDRILSRESWVMTPD